MTMRLAVLTCLVAIGALCGFAPSASADTKVLVKTRTYDISGTTGAALIEAMDRNGPKRHGFMTHAIALAAYTVDWDLEVTREGGVCRLRQANGTLDLTYTLPRMVSAATPALQKRWKRFFAGVRAHEHNHGRIARTMMRATEKSITGLEFADNWVCSKTHREARRRIKAVYAEYEAKQNAFDAREHRAGGHVERLIGALLRKQ
jgi:predicted secreted Zn-dependent protease